MSRWCEWFFQPRFEEENPNRLVEAVKIYRYPLGKCFDEWCNVRLAWICMMPICLAIVGIGCWMISLSGTKYISGGIFLILFGIITFCVSCVCFRSVKIKKRHVIDIEFGGRPWEPSPESVNPMNI